MIGDRLKFLEGSIVYISCLVIGSFIFNIEWKKFGVIVKESGNLKIVNNMLILLNSILLDSGSYMCVVFSGVGFDEKEIFFIFLGILIVVVFRVLW